MQNDPEKYVANYNEFIGVQLTHPRTWDGVDLRAAAVETDEQHKAMELGRNRVNTRVDEILGPDNRLTRADLPLPETRFIDVDDEHPNWAGYFNSHRNEIVVITGKINSRIGQVKVYIHEYLHFLSHNGRDDGERVDANVPISSRNNVGFRRSFGLDIREGKEGQNTHDYFVAFNEAVTEQLAIDIMPGVHETYDDYRALLSQVENDVVTRALGRPGSDGIFTPWSKEQVRHYIYKCFFKGDLDGFTRLLQVTYKKYDISERQFGLMTHKDDLPSVIEHNWRRDKPDSPPPSPSQIAAVVQKRLDSKTLDDYVTDVIGPEPSLGYGNEYDTHVAENKIVASHKETIGGREYEIDSLGFVIYRGEDASHIFKAIRSELDDLLEKARKSETDAEQIAEHMDRLLFENYFVSMLSDGFRDFYIQKHSVLDEL